MGTRNLESLNEELRSNNIFPASAFAFGIARTRFLPTLLPVPSLHQPDLFSDPAPTPPERLFLDWDRPLLEKAAEWLIASADDSGVIDLSHLLVIVPTRNAGRRLREMLANLADERGTAVMPPLVAPPSLLVRSEIGAARIGRPVAGDLEATAAWIEVLQSAKLGNYRSLFPVEPAAQDFSWSRGVARDLMRLRSSLGESGLTLGEVSRRLPSDHDESARWSDLARLEQAWLEKLADIDRSDRELARAIAAEKAELPEGVREVFLIGTPDPFPLAVDALQSLSNSGTPITVVVYAPESEAAAFDAWGRPDEEAWRNVPLEIPDFHQSVEIVANPDALIEAVTHAAAAVSQPAETLAIGAVDPELAPVLETALLEKGVAAFNPEGSRMNREGFHHLLRQLGKLLSNPDFETVRELFRVPEVGGYLFRKLGKWNSRSALQVLDECHSEHLVTDLTELITFLESDAEFLANSARESDRNQAPRYELTARGVSCLRDLRDSLRRGPLSRTLPPALRELVGSRRREGEAGEWSEKVLEMAAAPMMTALDQLSAIANADIDLSTADQFTLLVDQVGELGISEDRPSCAIELQGWLELLWEDAPHLIVAGMNDGIVPGAIVGDAYLPENLRSFRALRLTTNDQRLVRDLYLLRALIEPRRERGRIDLLVPKTTSDGDPLRPSRLFFRCPDDELPDRVSHLFREVDTPGSQASWSPGFLLQPGLEREGQPERAPRPIAVTAFARYLDSPFHFWANYEARMSEIDAEKAEMDAMDFGNFCHAVLERYGLDPDARVLTDPEAIDAYFQSVADEIAFARFGKRPGLAVRIQLDSARRRLAEAAQHEAIQRQDGWEIIGAEVKLRDAYPLEVAGRIISGTIDRIERRGDCLRVLDYKTTDKKNASLRDHLTEVTQRTPEDWPPDYARFEHLDFFPRSKSKPPGEKTYRFKKLQLPLYALAISRHEPEVEIRCGYFHLAKAISDVGPDDWEADAELLAATETCAAGVIDAISAGRFQLLRSGPYDDLVPLHLGVPERTIDFTHLGSGDESPRVS